jgi:hypothetical protein
MKKLLPAFCLFLVSCVTTKSVLDIDASEQQRGTEKTAGFLIVKRDGTKIIPTSLKYPTRGAWKTDDNFVWVDGQKMYYREMNAIQNQQGYMVILRNNKYKDGKELRRYRNGKISFYVGARNMDFTEFFFDKNGSEPEVVTYETFRVAIADNAEAVALFQKLFPKKKIPTENAGRFLSEDGARANLTKVIDLYNR